MNAIFLIICTIIFIIIFINHKHLQKTEIGDYKMPNVTVYSTNNCMKCKMTKKFLQQNNIDYLEINIDDEEFNLKEYGKTRQDYVKYIKDELLLSTMPIVVTEDDFWGDYRLNKLKELANKTKG